MPWPLAIGLACVERYAAARERRAARVAVGALAAREGYALVETLEVAGDIVRDDVTLAALRRLQAHSGAKTLLVHGFLPMPMTERIAAETSLSLIAFSPDDPER